MSSLLRSTIATAAVLSTLSFYACEWLPHGQVLCTANGDNACPEGWYCNPNADQRWYYYSKMNHEEALVFLTNDSHPPDGDLFSPPLHTAVQLPDSDGLQPRECIEVRIFAELPLP